MTPQQRVKFFKLLELNNPNPASELEYTTPFTLLIAVILSAQATDKSVNKATKLLFAHHTTPEDFLALGEEKLKEAIRMIGLYKTKTSHIMKTCALLVQKHNSQVPSTRAELEALPGVGRKTANILLNTVFGLSTIAVDTHVFRVSNRTGLAIGKTPAEVEHVLEKVVPQTFRKHAHHWLVLLGRYTCKARLPECWRCPVQAVCEYEKKSEKPS